MRKFSILLVFVYITVFSLYNFVIAANPASPIVPSDNIQDPGDPGTAWGGCGPSDSNCYVTFGLPSSATPTVDSDGEISYDTTVADFSTGLIRFYGTEEQGIVTMPIAEFTTPTNGDIVSYNSTTDEFELVSAPGITSDSLDYDDFEDTMDFDAALTLNQGSNAWSQTYTGTTTTGHSYVANSLTSGSALAVSSTSSTSGALVNIGLASTGAVSNTQKALNVSTSGANANSNQTTYGGYFSNTHTGSGVLTYNRALYGTASGGVVNTGMHAVASGGTTSIGLYATASGGTNNYAINSDGPLLLGGTSSNNILIQYVTGDNLSIGAGATQSGSFRSLFFGSSSGLNATNADDSLFLGLSSGDTATNASNSNFLGRFAGYQATNASNSNFLGESAGYQATNASNSIFMGYQAGYTSASAKNSIFLGNNAGANDAVDNTIDGYSVLIGPSTSTNGFSNSIAIGYGASNTSANELVIGSGDYPINNVYFGGGTSNTGFAASDYTINGSTAGSGLITNNLAGGDLALAGGKATGNAVGGSLVFQTSDAGASGATLQSLTTKAIILPSGNFGIGDTSPDYLLDVEKTGTDGYLLAIHDSDGECLHDPEAGAETVTCSSDERLKTNIVDSDSVLEYLNGFRIRNYDVIASGDHMTGVIAQEVKENYPELVSILPSGMYSVQLPNQWKLVKGIQELDLKLRNIEDFEDVDSSFGHRLRNWLSDITNGIERIFVKEVKTEKLCIGETCVTETELKELLENNNFNVNTPNEEVIEENTTEDENVIIDEFGEEVAPEEEIINEEILEENNESEEIINQQPAQSGEEQTNEEDQSSN